jgi:UDP-N-acetylglucosamine 2-epimerase (hydrolysing)
MWIDPEAFDPLGGLARRRILFLTGTRADFGKLKPLIEAVRGAEEFTYSIFATGMHMLARYGSTVLEIQRAGFQNIFTYINQDGVESGMDTVLSNTIQGLSYYVREFPPELIVVHGDRVETLAGATVGALRNILVAHVEGGEVSGTVDELLRHAVTKLAHLHYVSNEEAKWRLMQMGELEGSIYVIGSPNIDVMLSDGLPALEEVRARYEISFPDFGILAYHPVTTELDRLPAHCEAVLEAAVESGMNFVALYPNSDPGSHHILSALERLRGHPRFTLIPSMRFEHYLTLLRNARVLLGNSSSGIHEAPVYGIPTVNVGSRQMQRFRYGSILDVPETKEAILGALRSLPVGVAPTMHFGSGQSAQLFLQSLRDVDFWRVSRQKQFRDLEVATAR